MTNRAATPAHVIVLMALLFTIDGLVIFARKLSAGKLSAFACSFLPHLYAPSILLPNDLVAFAQQGCATSLQEPGVSIIFYMVKVALSFWGAAYFLALTIANARLLMQTVQRYIEKRAKGLEIIKNEMTPPLVLMLVFTTVQFGLNLPVSRFRTDIFSKFFEDLACLVLFSALASFIRGFCIFVAYTIKRYSPTK